MTIAPEHALWILAEEQVYNRKMAEAIESQGREAEDFRRVIPALQMARNAIRERTALARDIRKMEKERDAFLSGDGNTALRCVRHLCMILPQYPNIGVGGIAKHIINEYFPLEERTDE